MGDATQTRQIIELLKNRHSGMEWAHFAELMTGTGGNYGKRSIDFFAFNLWPSKNFLKVSYEIKVSRADFARELLQPQKREAAESLSNECYFAMPCGLVQVDEIPEGWGLIEMVANGLRVKKRARQRKVDALPMEFIASLARRTTDEPSQLPDTVWLMAGKEVGVDQLRDVASEAVKNDVERQIREAKREAEQYMSERYENARHIAGIVTKRLGYGVSAEEVEAFFEKNTTFIPRPLVNELRRLRGRIDDVLGMEKAND